MEEEGAAAKVEKTEHEILKITRPDYWNSWIKGNAEVQTERDFEQLLIMVKEHYPTEDLDKTTIFTFYSLLDRIKQKAKEHGRK